MKSFAIPCDGDAPSLPEVLPNLCFNHSVPNSLYQESFSCHRDQEVSSNLWKKFPSPNTSTSRDIVVAGQLHREHLKQFSRGSSRLPEDHSKHSRSPLLAFPRSHRHRNLLPKKLPSPVRNFTGNCLPAYRSKFQRVVNSFHPGEKPEPARRPCFPLQPRLPRLLPKPSWSHFSCLIYDF